MEYKKKILGITLIIVICLLLVCFRIFEIFLDLTKRKPLKFYSSSGSEESDIESDQVIKIENKSREV